MAKKTKENGELSEQAEKISAILDKIEGQVKETFESHLNWIFKVLSRKEKPNKEARIRRYLKIRDDIRDAELYAAFKTYQEEPNADNFKPLLDIAKDLSDRYEGKIKPVESFVPQTEDDLGGIVFLPQIKEINGSKGKKKKSSLEAA